MTAVAVPFFVIVAGTVIVHEHLPLLGVLLSPAVAPTCGQVTVKAQVPLLPRFVSIENLTVSPTLASSGEVIQIEADVHVTRQECVALVQVEVLIGRIRATLSSHSHRHRRFTSLRAVRNIPGRLALAVVDSVRTDACHGGAVVGDGEGAGRLVGVGLNLDVLVLSALISFGLSLNLTSIGLGVAVGTLVAQSASK